MPLRSSAAKPASPEDLKGTVQALSDGTLSARAYCESCLARIRASEPGLKAWIALDDERALTIAAARDVERSQGAYTGALHGVPVGVKDLYDTDDLPTEMGSPAFVGNQPGKNAELVGRILAAGGYVKRTPDPEDRRRNIVAITAAGAARFRRLDKVLVQVQDELLRPLSTAERELLIDFLRRVLQASNDSAAGST